MTKFRFSVHEEELPHDGSEVGEMEVTGSLGAASSMGHEPSQSMLIYNSLSDLLDGVTPLVKSGRGSFKFRATSLTRAVFSLKFTLKKHGPMLIESGNTLIDESPIDAFALALWTGAKEFTDRHLGTLPRYDVVREALEGSLLRFEDTLSNKHG